MMTIGFSSSTPVVPRYGHSLSDVKITTDEQMRIRDGNHQYWVISFAVR
jgi:hypothetical protein